jgi:hypothetical protein
MTNAPAQSDTIPCPCCNGPTHLVQQIDVKGMPEIYVFYCSRCQYVEAIKEERAA